MAGRGLRRGREPCTPDCFYALCLPSPWPGEDVFLSQAKLGVVVACWRSSSEAQADLEVGRSLTPLAERSRTDPGCSGSEQGQLGQGS